MDSPPVRFDDQETEEYQSADEGMNASPDSESEEYELELDSMTGKGISRLCSELLELKKASDEDFQRNIYSNISVFLRIFEEVGGIENEIMKMENHVSTQKRLVEELMNSFHPETILDKMENVKDEWVEDLEPDFPSWLETRMQNILETIDILMSERRMEEALIVLEKENQALQNLLMEKDSLLPTISPFASAISHWRSRLAEQFASLALHKRVTWPELHNALFGLIRLGENHRASTILLNFFHLQLQNGVNELDNLASFPHGTYILELAKVVFFTVIQASRSYVVLFGETSPYTLDIMQWARAELEVIYHNFYMHVKSIPETSMALGLAVETMKLSFSFCSLLEHERLSFQPDIVKLMKPCIAEVLQMHFDQLRKVVSLFATTDNWVLGKFLVSGILSNKSSLQNVNGELKYFQVTSSGRKFITLMQMVLNDAFQFHVFHLENLIFKGLTDLFDEYILTLERAISIRKPPEERYFPLSVSALKLKQQISILINSSELVQLLPTLVQHSFDSTIFASDVVLPEQDMLSSLKELDFWKLAIQEISVRLKFLYCRIFVSGVLSLGNSEALKGLDTCSCGHCVLGSSEDLMPSFAFQELFVFLRHLEKQFESILLVEDGMMTSLLNGIMMGVIFQLSENWEFLKNSKSHRQLLLDVHFLVEIAKAGDYYSDNLMVAVSDLMKIMKLESLTEELHPNSEINEQEWAFHAAKMAFKTLFEAKIVSRSTSICSSSIEDDPAAFGTDATNASIDELDVDDFIPISAEDFERDCSILGSTASQPEMRGLTCIDESESNEFQLFGVLVKPEIERNSEHRDGMVNDSDRKNFGPVNGSSDALAGEAILVLQTGDDGHEISRIEVQHSEENGQNDRTEAEDVVNRGEVLRFEGKLLAGNDKDLSQEKTFGGESLSGDHITRVGNNAGYSLETNGGKDGINRATGGADRFKHFRGTERSNPGQITDFVEKNKLGRSTIP